MHEADDFALPDGIDLDGFEVENSSSREYSLG
jgi:hypothetical protein